MSIGLQVWSQTASANSTSDSNVNWAEGQAPSSVNDSARAQMASMAKWRDDNNGTIATGGTTAAYTATSSQVSSGLTDGYTIAVKFHATNDNAATLNVDGSGAKNIQAVAGTNVTSGVILANSIQKLTYSSGSTGWIIQGNNAVQSLGTDNIAAAAVTYAKIQNVAASRLLGNPTGGATSVSEISLGTNLSFSGTTLNAGNNTPVVTTITSTATVTWQSTTQNGNFPLYLHVRMVAGGGGGGATTTNAGSTGTDTSFNNWTAVAGGKGAATAGAPGAGGTGGSNGTGTLITRINGQGGTSGFSGATGNAFSGGVGGNSFYAGGGSTGATNGTGGAAAANTGGGGQGGGGQNNASSGSGGGAGEFVEFIVTSPSTAYTVQCGAGGSGGSAGGSAGGNGAAGRIEVIAYWQ